MESMHNRILRWRATMQCQRAPTGSSCGARANHFEQIDLSPPADCLDDLSHLQFSSLASTSTAPEFTCDRPTGGPAKPPNATWPHCIRGVQSSRKLRFADIGVGMPTYLKRAQVGEGADVHDATALCLQGVLLACARITWMQAAGPSLEVLMLMDCLPICNKRKDAGAALHACQPAEHMKPGDESRQFIAKHGRFIYSTPRWLASSEESPSATVHLRCSWEEYSERTSYRKTGLLLRLMHEVMPVCTAARIVESPRPAQCIVLRATPTCCVSFITALRPVAQAKHFYLKIDADTVLRPHNLLGFLRYLDVRVHPSSRLYFGTRDAGPGFGVELSKRIGLPPALSWQPALAKVKCTETRASCRMAGFSTHRRKVMRQVRNASTVVGTFPQYSPSIRSLDSFAALQNEMTDKAHLRVAFNTFSVPYAAGGAYGMSSAVLEALTKSNCVVRAGGIRRCDTFESFPRNRKQYNVSSCLRALTHRIEDAAVGLCMHLHSVRLLNSECFRQSLLLPRFKGRELNAMLPAEATNGTAMAHALSPARAYDGSWLRNTDDTAEARLTRHPITLHPVIRADNYLGWWKVLEARDKRYKLPDHFLVSSN